MGARVYRDTRHEEVEGIYKANLCSSYMFLYSSRGLNHDLYVVETQSGDQMIQHQYNGVLCDQIIFIGTLKPISDEEMTAGHKELAQLMGVDWPNDYERIRIGELVKALFDLEAQGCKQGLVQCGMGVYILAQGND